MDDQGDRLYRAADARCGLLLALAENFGFGEERLKRFHDAFNAKYAEIRELEKGDTKPPFSVIGSRPACRLIEHPYAAPIAYCSMFGSDDKGTKK